MSAPQVEPTDGEERAYADGIAAALRTLRSRISELPQDVRPLVGQLIQEDADDWGVTL